MDYKYNPKLPPRFDSWLQLYQKAIEEKALGANGSITFFLHITKEQLYAWENGIPIPSILYLKDDFLTAQKIKLEFSSDYLAEQLAKELAATKTSISALDDHNLQHLSSLILYSCFPNDYQKELVNKLMNLRKLR